MNTRRPEEVAGDGGALDDVPDEWGGEPLRSVQRAERFPVSCTFFESVGARDSATPWGRQG